jgi:hypothetical protein
MSKTADGGIVEHRLSMFKEWRIKCRVNAKEDVK